MCVSFFYLILAKKASSVPKSYSRKTMNLVSVLLNKIILNFYDFFFPMYFCYLNFSQIIQKFFLWNAEIHVFYCQSRIL